MSKRSEQFTPRRAQEIVFATDAAVVAAAKRLANKRARGNFLIAEEFTGFFIAGYMYARKHAKIVRKK